MSVDAGAVAPPDTGEAAAAVGVGALTGAAVAALGPPAPAGAAPPPKSLPSPRSLTVEPRFPPAACVVSLMMFDDAPPATKLLPPSDVAATGV